MAKKAKVYTGTEWVDLAAATADLSQYSNLVTNQPTFRNVIINGDMRIDQRRDGSSFNTPGAGGVYTYATDRWFSYSSSTQAATQRLYASGSYYTRIAVSSSLTALTLGQRVESINSYHLAGKTVTLSFRMSSTASSVTWAASYANTTDTFGTQASPTVTSITSGTVTPTSSFANYSVTFLVPSGATTGLQITFTTASEFGINMQLTNVQLELGTIATSFEYRPIGTELALCQRYYWRISGNATNSGKPIGFGNTGPGTTATAAFVNCPVTMRIVPTLIETSTMSIADQNAATAVTSSSIVAAQSSEQYVFISASTAGGLTTFRPYVYQLGGASAFFALGAEL
jgi:hypothetical protein